MKLSVRDRLLLLEILPREGDITTIRLVRKLREDLSFSEEEHEVLGLSYTQNPNGTTGVTWNELNEVPVEFEFGLKVTELIRDSLNTLNTQKKLTEAHLALYDLFTQDE
jgi:hypothetical protein